MFIMMDIYNRGGDFAVFERDCAEGLAVFDGCELSLAG